MRLKQFAETAQAPIDFAAVSADAELARDVQGQLTLASLLDPPVDGKFGAVSSWALSEFCRLKKLNAKNGFTPQIANSLLAADIADALPLQLDASFASKIIRAMQRRGYWMSRHPQCYTIAYVEACSEAGAPVENKRNEFNDVRTVIRVTDIGAPELVTWEGTTEPGRYWTENPMNPTGAARTAFGQYKSWSVGTHLAGRPGGHEALVQVDDVTVYRDKDKNYLRDGDKRYTGLFGINQHWGYDLPKNNLGQSSAGCLVGRTKDGHREFMRLLKSDARYKANRAYRFMAAVMPVAALSEAQLPAGAPH
jgi:hypothetical protein